MKPIPNRRQPGTPRLRAPGVPAPMESTAFRARQTFETALPDGVIQHAEMRSGDSIVLLGEAPGDAAARPCLLHLDVEDADATDARALRAGATPLRAPADRFYGDRTAGVRDPGGNDRWIATHVEDVTPEEMKRRARAAASQPAGTRPAGRAAGHAFPAHSRRTAGRPGDLRPTARNRALPPPRGFLSHALEGTLHS